MASMNKAAELLKKNKIVVYPTDTLYGILGRALSRRVVERIYRVKGRDENKPFIILISAISDLNDFGIKLSDRKSKFLNKIWPGPVSVILPCTSTKFSYLHRGTKGLAFRMPKDKELLKILSATGPLVAPSANPQGETPASNINKAKKYFGNKVDGYYGKNKKTGKPSTIISLVDTKPKIIRQGVKKVSLTFF